MSMKELQVTSTKVDNRPWSEVFTFLLFLIRVEEKHEVEASLVEKKKKFFVGRFTFLEANQEKSSSSLSTLTTFGDDVSERHIDIDDSDASIGGFVDSSDVGDMEKPLVSDAV